MATGEGGPATDRTDKGGCGLKVAELFKAAALAALCGEVAERLGEAVPAHAAKQFGAPMPCEC